MTRGWSKDNLDIDLSGKRYKMYLVEVDDDDRERVLSARVDNIQLEVVPNYSEVMIDYSTAPVARYVDSWGATVTMNMVPNEDGTIFRVENFNEEDEE